MLQSIIHLAHSNERVKIIKLIANENTLQMK